MFLSAKGLSGAAGHLRCGYLERENRPVASLPGPARLAPGAARRGRVRLLPPAPLRQTALARLPETVYDKYLFVVHVLVYGLIFRGVH